MTKVPKVRTPLRVLLLLSPLSAGIVGCVQPFMLCFCTDPLQSSIWGLSKQGKTCKLCGLSVHSKCELKVIDLRYMVRANRDRLHTPVRSPLNVPDPVDHGTKHQIRSREPPVFFPEPLPKVVSNGDDHLGKAFMLTHF